jgi:hypothetical protein
MKKKRKKKKKNATISGLKYHDFDHISFLYMMMLIAACLDTYPQFLCGNLAREGVLFSPEMHFCETCVPSFLFPWKCYSSRNSDGSGSALLMEVFFSLCNAIGCEKWCKIISFFSLKKERKI